MQINTLAFNISGGILLLFAIAILVHIFVIRHWYRNWGATPDERRMALPGDEFIPPHSDVTTRAITILMPKEKIWPWLLLIGVERAGFYSYYWMENLFGAAMPSEKAPLPNLEPLKVGDPVSMMGGGPPQTKLTVSRIEPGSAISFGGWTFFLKPISPESTRLIVRYPFTVGTPGDKAFFYGFFEIIHFILESGMMMGIKQRAETTA